MMSILMTGLTVFAIGLVEWGLWKFARFVDCGRTDYDRRFWSRYDDFVILNLLVWLGLPAIAVILVLINVLWAVVI